MFISISGRGEVSVEDTDDFRRFKIVSELAQSDMARLVSALQDLALVETAERAWVFAAEMSKRSGRGSDATWCASFEQMIESSKKYGYIREHPTMIAAHIEWTAA